MDAPKKYKFGDKKMFYLKCKVCQKTVAVTGTYIKIISSDKNKWSCRDMRVKGDDPETAIAFCFDHMREDE